VIKNRKYDLVCEVFNELCGTVVLKQSSFTVKKRTDNKSYGSASIIDS
jgi:hypothetical protein